MALRTLLNFGLAALLVCGTYPLALLGQFGADVVQGDGEIVRDLLYGSHRVLAVTLVSGWVASLVWVLGFWAAIAAQSRWLPRFRVPVTLALAGAVLVAAFADIAPVPAMFGWLLLAALILHSIYSFFRSVFFIPEEQCVSQP